MTEDIEQRIMNEAKKVGVSDRPPDEAQQKEAALKVIRLARELTDALGAARDLGVPMIIQVDDIPIRERILTQVLARMLVE